MEKILITGTGRCGTTFLIKLFSFLDFDTGFNKNNYTYFIDNNCNSGMELFHTEKYYILKNPRFLSNIEQLVQDKSIIIKTVILPIRDLKLSSISRTKYGNNSGGLWNATDELSQTEYYKDILSNYLCVMTKYDIHTIFIDFDKMVNDKTYLFNKLKNILDEKNIDFETFSTVYDEISLTSKGNAITSENIK